MVHLTTDEVKALFCIFKEFSVKTKFTKWSRTFKKISRYILHIIGCFQYYVKKLKVHMECKHRRNILYIYYYYNNN